MNSKVETVDNGANPLDIAKYVAAMLVVAAGIAGWYLLGWATPIRALVVILSLVAAAFVALPTAKGRQTREFVNESMFELRKVVWPTQDETRRTTLVILVVVVIVSIILFLFDFSIQAVVEQILDPNSALNTTLFGG